MFISRGLAGVVGSSAAFMSQILQYYKQKNYSNKKY